MKFFLIISLCLFFSFDVFAQAAETAEKSEVKIENIALMRDDGEGKPGDETEIFKTTDSPIHFQITLDSVKATTVKMILAAVAVGGLKPGTKIMTIGYKTNGEQNIVTFRSSPQNAWLAGKYRVDIFIDDRLAGNKEFTIEKPSGSTGEQTNFTPPEPKPKAKPKRKN